jgi:radical SAM protein with 4Fe4S-binding SPASM domain
MNKEKSISVEKVYSFPDSIDVIKHNEKYLIIARDTACWIVLDNAEQLSFLELLRELSIKDALGKFEGSYEDAISVITQIEARRFDSLEVVPVKEKTCMIYLTSACNLRCPHCYLSAGKARDDELTTDEIKALLTVLSKEGVKELTFSGGEICLRDDLMEILRFAKQLSFETKLLTNGTLWTRAQIDAAAQLISAVQISIDGYSEEENAKVRGEGNFLKALKVLDGFLMHDISVQLAITPFPERDLKTKIEDYARFGIELNAKYLGRDFKILFTTGIMDGRELKLTDNERDTYKAIMETVTSRYLGEDASDYPFILTHKSRKIMDNCSYGCLYVSSNGDIQMCSRSGLKPVANIRKDSFAKIMELSKSASNASNVNNLVPCKDCCLKYICGGGCRVVEFKAFKEGPAVLSELPIRPCSKEKKDYFYDLMIRTNKSIFC